MPKEEFLANADVPVGFAHTGMRTRLDKYAPLLKRELDSGSQLGTLEFFYEALHNTFDMIEFTTDE
jgi:hypothetical protein